MNADIVIVGAGVIGCAVADALSAVGAGRIVVVDRGRPGAEASSAAAGLLAVASSRAPGGALFALRRASVALFPALVDDLRERTGIDAGYCGSGALDIAFSDAEADALAGLVSRRVAQGLRAELLSPRAASGLEPALNAMARAAAFFPEDRCVDPVRLVEALHAAAAARGVEFRFGAAVTGIDAAGTRVRAVVANGESIALGRLVIAAGAWSREIGKLLRVKIPVIPDKGEMVAVTGGPTIRHTLSWNDGYLVPRNGEIVIGATSVRGCDDKTVSAVSLALLLGRAAQMVPELAAATLARSWAGLRPCSTIRRPIIGPLPGYENALLATGHHRAGIMLAPITAKLITELIVNGATSMPIEPFCYRRH